MLKRYFFRFIEALASKGILNTLKKKELHQPWSALNLLLSLSLHDYEIAHFFKFREFISREASVINLFAILQVFLVVFASEVNYLAVFLKRVKRFQEKLNIF